MRAITKNNEPTSLAQHRCAAHADYDNYTDKDGLRQSLVTEQRGLCCYCLSRIRPLGDEMKIAHWHSRELHSVEQLDYTNLLGACKGNEGQPLNQQHCDTRQGKRDISRNPADPERNIEHIIHFEGDGTISSSDSKFNSELNEVLNLNAKRLKNNRKAVLDAFKFTLEKRDLPLSTLNRWLREWNGETNGENLKPFCQVVVYWLRKRLARI